MEEQWNNGVAKGPNSKKELPLSSTDQINNWVRWILHILRRCILLRPVTPKGQQLKPTAWLDGLRGFAAFLVYIHHNQLWVHNPFNNSKWFENSYGFEGQYYLGSMHGIRMFFSGGHYAVGTFFVISGYVLSLRPLTLIHAGDHEKLAQSLSSALFRRWLRLYLPVLATTFLWMTSWHAFGWWCRPFVPEPTYLAEVTKWVDQVKNYMFIYKDAGLFPFHFLYWNLHTWSIPFEFRGSLGVYTVLLALSMSTRTTRLFCTLALTWFFLYMVDGWFLASFFSGMLLCELDLLAGKGELPNFLMVFEPYKKIVFLGLFIVSIYIGGAPLANNDYEELKKSPGWRYLALLKPDATRYHYRFYIVWAATFMVAAVPRLPWLRSFFNTRFCQYLGKVSFSLYLVHGPVIWTLGNVVTLFLGWPKEEADYPYPSYYNTLPLARDGWPMGFEPAFWVAQLVLLPATLWISNVVTVLIDEPSVKFAAWLRNKTLLQRGAMTVEMSGLIK